MPDRAMVDADLLGAVIDAMVALRVVAAAVQPRRVVISTDSDATRIGPALRPDGLPAYSLGPFPPPVGYYDPPQRGPVEVVQHRTGHDVVDSSDTSLHDSIDLQDQRERRVAERRPPPRVVIATQ